LKEETRRRYSWSVALYGAEIWTHRKIEAKYLEVLKCAGEGWRSVGLIM
jgi:hypothetical protein